MFSLVGLMVNWYLILVAGYCLRDTACWFIIHHFYFPLLPNSNTRLTPVVLASGL
jgi:hypothetical protein